MNNNRVRTTSLFGLSAPLIYAMTVLVGAALRPEYSHLRDPISSLMAIGSPNLLLINVLFAIYNLALLMFGLGWWASEKKSSATRLAALMIAAVGFLGLVLTLYPQDQIGSPVTAGGATHIAISGITALLTMLAMLLRGSAERAGSRAMSVYSFASVAFVFVTGGLAAVGIAHGWPLAGLFERFTIGGFLQWIFFEAFVLFYRTRPTP